MIKICKYCGKSFEPNPSKFNYNQIYCNKKCNRKAYSHSNKGKLSRIRVLKRVKEKYHNDSEYNKHLRNIYHKYATSEKGRKTKAEYRKRYRKTIKGILVNLKYIKSDKRKKSLKKYTDSEKGKENSMRASIKRRTLKQKIKHDYSYEEWTQKKKDTFGICPRCNRWVGIDKLSLDHIIPISKVPEGFVYTINDVQPLCRSCNSAKNNRIENYSFLK